MVFLQVGQNYTTIPKLEVIRALFRKLSQSNEATYLQYGITCLLIQENILFHENDDSTPTILYSIMSVFHCIGCFSI